MTTTTSEHAEVKDPFIEEIQLSFKNGDTERTVSREALRALAETRGITEAALIHELLAQLRDQALPHFGAYDLPSAEELAAMRKGMPKEPADAKSLFDR